MKTITTKQMQALDKRAIEHFGIPSIALMENAGFAFAREVLKEIRNKKARVCIVCGVGNNAGDGYVVARHLLNHGIKVRVCSVGKLSKLKGDVLLNCIILKNLKQKIVEVEKISAYVVRKIKRADIVVDAIFGTGLSRDVVGMFKDAICAINENSKRTYSVDIPSGLNGTTGKIHGVAIKAKKTITFQCAKTGLYKGEGLACAGRVVVVDIGIPV